MSNILILHGINYYNAGDHGILLSMLLAIWKHQPAVNIKVASPFLAHMQTDGDYITAVKEGFEGQYPEEIPDLYQLPVGQRRKLRVLAYGLKVVGFTALLTCMPYEVRKILAKSTKFSKELLHTDLVLSKGGGFLLDRGTSYKIPTHLLTIWIAILMRKKVVIYAQTIGPFDGRLSKKIAQFVLKRATLVMVRDVYSKDYAETKLGLESTKVCLTADSAFALSTRIGMPRSVRGIRVKSPNQMKRICITLVSPKFSGLHGQKFENNYCSMIASVASQLVEKKYSVIFIPHLESGGNSDRILAQKILKLCPALAREDIEILPPVNPLKIIETMEDCLLGICSRMHSMIFAINARIPFLGLSYLPKSDSMLSEAGLNSWSLSLSQLASGDSQVGAEKMLSKIEDILVNIDESYDLAISANHYFTSRSKTNIDKISPFLNGTPTVTS